MFCQNIKEVAKNIFSKASWFLPAGVYFKFRNVDSAEIVEEFEKKQDVHAGDSKKRLCDIIDNEKNKLGELTELYRNSAAIFVPLTAYCYDVLNSFFSEQHKNDENYFKLAIIAYIASTAYATIIRSCFKSYCFDDLHAELSRSQTQKHAHLAQQQYTAQIQAQKPFCEVKKKYRYLECKPDFFRNGVISAPKSDAEWQNLGRFVQEEYKHIDSPTQGESGTIS